MSKAGEAAMYIVALAVLAFGSILYWLGFEGLLLSFVWFAVASVIFGLWVVLAVFIEMTMKAQK